MAKTPQVEFEQLIRSRTPFEGSSVTAELDGLEYNIYSSSTLIATYDTESDELTYFDEEMYSITAGRLQNLIRHIEG